MRQLAAAPFKDDRMLAARDRNMHIETMNSRILTGYLIAILFYLQGSAFAGWARDEAATITFTHRERYLKPGEVVLLKAQSERRLKSLSVEAFDRVFPAYDEGGGVRWSALIGIDLETKPGRYEIKLQGIDKNEKEVIVRKLLLIDAKKFPTRALAVDEKFVNPPADEKIRIEEESKRVKAIMASVTREKLWHGAFRVPVPGEVISTFGKRNIYNNQPRSPHTGTDFRSAVGTPIRAPNAGRIVLAENLYYSGNTLIIDHGYGLYSYLGHLSRFSAKEGDMVKAGDVIGKVGATGRVTGPHLHWSVRLVTTQVDPMSLVSVLGSGGKAKSKPRIGTDERRSK
jgi:murein DD-endopeptidase MepM/ murein hydrolase activator NlpD